MFVIIFAALCAGSAGCVREVSPKESLEEFVGAGNSEAYSTFDKAGIAEIAKRGVVRLDMSGRVLDRAKLALRDGKSGPILGNPSLPDMLLIVDGPAGQISTSTGTLSIGSYGDDPFGTVSFYREFDTIDEAHADILDEQWGFNRAQVDQWRESIDRMPASDTDKRVLGLGLSPAGLVTEVTARVRADRSALILYGILLQPRLYTPEAIGNIIEYGYSVPR